MDSPSTAPVPASDSPAAAAAAAAPHTHYALYWKMWGVLLGLTVGMVLITNPALLLVGITVKAGIIMMVFMHLRYEHVRLLLAVMLGIFFTSLVLYGLIVPDGMAM